MSGPSSSSEPRRDRIRASALLAAYGDALGFISELTDRKGVRRRAGVDHISRTVAWRRRIGGQFGPTVQLPSGAVSDDTQLRLATSRSIRPSGAFDVETFSEIELTVWPAYALGAGRGSLAAAAGLRKRDVTWATNFFDVKRASYLSGGGNGAAMRIQPHVWAKADGESWSWLADVVTNSVCTHGHPRGFVGAAFHAACLDHALVARQVPEPEDWLRFIDELHMTASVVRDDERLSHLWLRQWENRSERSLSDAVDEALGELRDDALLCARLEPGQRGSYVDAVEALKAFDAAQRGSGTKTALLAAAAAWLFRDRELEGLTICADYVGTDTDSIATMLGAILGAAGHYELPGALMDEDYVVREADRMWAASTGRRPPRFPYPDMLNWRAPRSATDAVEMDDEGLHIAGLGPARADGERYVTEGSSPGIWQWATTWFGQSLLVKRRERPPSLVAFHRVTPTDSYTQADLLVSQPAAGVADRPRPTDTGESSVAPSTGQRSYAQPPLRQPSASGRRRSIDEITNDVISSGLDDVAIGAGLREVARGARAIEDGIAYTSIVIKALITRENRQRRQNGS